MNRLTETRCFPADLRPILCSDSMLRKSHVISPAPGRRRNANLKPWENLGAIRPGKAFSLGARLFRTGSERRSYDSRE